MKNFLLISIAICSLSLQAQSLKTEKIEVYVPSYATRTSPDNMKTFMGAFVPGEGDVLPFTEQEYLNELNFQSLTPHTDNNSIPDLMFMLRGISKDDLDMSVTRSKSKETYSVSVTAKSSAVIGLLVSAKGEFVHYYPIPVKYKVDAEGNKIPEIFDFTFAEEEKYLIIKGEDRVQASPYLVQEFLKRSKLDTYLTSSLLPDIYDLYDYRANNEVESFYFVKDKKMPSLEEDTKSSIIAMEKVASTMSSLETLRASKDQYAPFIDFWKEQLTNYDLSDKSDRKIAWGVLVNLHKISLISEDFNTAKYYLDQVIASDYKKWATTSIRKNYEKKWELYERNYDAATGNRKYVDAYIVDDNLEAIAKKEAIKENNINEAKGYVLTNDGEKMEGKISMRFSELESEGNIVDISGETTAKRVKVTYINSKGKTKYKSYKCKDVSEIVVDGKTFEAVNPKRPFLEQEALSFSMLNNTIFMQRIYQSDKVRLFKDLTGEEAYFFQIPGEKKAETASLELFQGCDALTSFIQSEAYANTQEYQTEIAKLYTEDCN